MTWLNKLFINSDNCFCWFLQWKEAKPEELMDSKLRCVFEMPVENEKMVRLLLTVSAFHIFVHLRLRYLCKYWRQCRSAVPPASILHALKNAQIPERKIIFLLQWQPPLSSKPFRELVTVNLYSCHKMSPNTLITSNANVLIELRYWLCLCRSSWGRWLYFRTQWNTIATVFKQVHLSCALQLPPYEQIEMWKRAVQHHCDWSNCRWSSFSILLLFTWAVSSQWVSRAVHSVGFTSTWSACGYWQVPYYRSPSPSLCSVLCSSLLQSLMCLYIWPSSPSFSSYSPTVFQMDVFFFPIQSVCNRWLLPDSTQLLTGCPRYDLLALLSVNALIDSYIWVPAIILFIQCW